MTAPGLPQWRAEAIFSLLWSGTQLRVVAHQTIGPDFHPVFSAPLGHQFTIGEIIPFTKNVG